MRWEATLADRKEIRTSMTRLNDKKPDISMVQATIQFAKDTGHLYPSE
jgi:hypothetical protein